MKELVAYFSPTIINTFLEKYDFKNKEIVCFATSDVSGFLINN